MAKIEGVTDKVGDGVNTRKPTQLISIKPLLEYTPEYFL